MAAVALTVLSLAGLLTVAEAEESSASTDYGTVWNLLTPGSRGNVSTTQLLTVLAGGGTTAIAGKNAPANHADQLEMYDALTTIEPTDLTPADLDELYKRAGFEPERVVSTKRPRPGVTIQRDQFGVPYIHGATYADTMFGAGYAAIEDRMFLMDVLRHAGAAKMAEFVGDSPANIAMDRAQLRTAFYTPQEAAAQIEKAAQRYPELGPRLLEGVDAFLAGINAAQNALCPAGLPTGMNCPAEYAALQKFSRPWTRADLAYIASLVGGRFGTGGGGEAANATFYQLLEQRFGRRTADGVYRDLRTKLDSDAPTTLTVPTSYGGGRETGIGRPGVALPDLDGATAPGTGRSTAAVTKGLPAASPPPGLAKEQLEELESIELGIGLGGMSNALLVTAQESVTGHPLAVFGPQTGYTNPPLLVEQVLVGPHVRARGVSFAGLNLAVQLGRGVDYAWSATSAYNDVVDTVAERLCNVDGTPASVNSTGYRVGADCVPMRHDQHVEHTVPNVTLPGLPKTYTFDIWRTRHGIVQERTTVGGHPVALVRERSTYGHEFDSMVGFLRFNDPAQVRDAESFMRAASAVDFTFNWFYVDSRDIATYTSSLLPVRAPGVAFDFPRWGDRAYDWRGYVGFEGHPRQVNPEQGYLVSWNNRQALGWSAPDNNWAWGPVHRSQALSEPLARAIQGAGTVETAELVGVMSDAATRDARAGALLPGLLEMIGADPELAPAIGLLRRWLEVGAPRADRDRDGHYAHEAAIALFDTWYQDSEHSLAHDVMRGRLGPLVAHVPGILDRHPRSGNGNSWLDVPWYGWVHKELNARLGQTVGTPLTYAYCGDGTLASCRQVVRASLGRALRAVLAEQGVDGVSDLVYDKTIDGVVHQSTGVVGVRRIDWQNRGTFQQIVEFVRHR